MNTTDADTLSKTWDDQQLELLCAILRNKIMTYEAERAEHGDKVDAIINRCTEALSVFTSEQQMRAQEREPRIIEQFARYPINTDVHFRANGFGWHEGVVIGHERGGWIRVRHTSGPNRGIWTAVIRSTDIKLRTRHVD